MKIGGCTTKPRHIFIGKKKDGVEVVQSVRHDFYQTPSTVIASLFLKKIDKENSTVKFASATSVELDLHTSDNKHYQETAPLFASINPEKSSFRITPAKLELTLVKADGASWPVLRADEPQTGEIYQVGKAGRA